MSGSVSWTLERAAAGLGKVRRALFGDPARSLPKASKEGPSGTRNTYSRFGGLWIDERGSDAVLAERIRSGALSPSLGALISDFIRDGYVVLPGAVDRGLTRQIREELEAFWDNPPADALVENWTDNKMQFVLPQRSLRAGATKLLDYHAFSPAARAAIAAPAVVEFLKAVFETKPKAFQSLTFWRGSQQPIHKDSAYVQISGEPMHLAATWLALEDIHAGTGELEYYIGSHRDPDFLFAGEHKWLEAAPHEHDQFLSSLHADAEKYDHEKGSFIAREGDVLVWHADLAHGGGRITKPDATRQSLVTHFTTEHDDPPYVHRVRRTPTEEKGCLFVSHLRQI